VNGGEGRGVTSQEGSCLRHLKRKTGRIRVPGGRGEGRWGGSAAMKHLAEGATDRLEVL
jgi:hypothetical protein